MASRHSLKVNSMSIEIPGDLAPFVERMVSERRFQSTEEVMLEGLRLLQARERLRDEVREGFDQLDRGQMVTADEVFARAERRIAEIEQDAT